MKEERDERRKREGRPGQDGEKRGAATGEISRVRCTQDAIIIQTPVVHNYYGHCTTVTDEAEELSGADGEDAYGTNGFREQDDDHSDDDDD